MLAVDPQGRVWCFGHGAGDWRSPTLAFDTVARLHEHVAFQAHFEPPPHDADLASLRALAQAITTFAKGRRGARYSRLDAARALEHLRSEIGDKRSWSSKQGKALAACQAIGLRCDQALRDAGAPGAWTCRAMAQDGSVLGVVGDFTPPWTEARVVQLLTPLVGKLALLCKQRPARRSDS